MSAYPGQNQAVYPIKYISDEEHEFIQHKLSNLASDLESSVEPLRSNSSMVFAPLYENTDDHKPGSRNVATVIDLSISSKRDDYASSSRSSHSIAASFSSVHAVKGQNTLLEHIHAEDISSDEITSSTVLSSNNIHLEANSIIYLDQLAKTLAGHIGVKTLDGIQDRESGLFAKDAIKQIFNEIASDDNNPKILIGDVTTKKSYINRVFALGDKDSYEIDSDRQAILSITETRNPKSRQIGFTAIAMVDFDGNGPIFKHLDYKFFEDRNDKPDAFLTLRSSSYDEAGLKILVTDRNYDTMRTIISNIRLLEQIPGFKK